MSEEQQEELDAVGAIFDDAGVFEWQQGDEGFQGIIRVKPELPSKRVAVAATLSLKDCPLRGDVRSDEADVTEGPVSVSALPPVTLTFSLPTEYPSVVPRYSIRCPWLCQSQVERPCSHCLTVFRLSECGSFSSLFGKRVTLSYSHGWTILVQNCWRILVLLHRICFVAAP